MAISKGSSTKNPGNPSKSLKSSLNEKTGKLLEAAQVISNVLDTLETDAQCQLPRVLSLSRNASAVSLNASAKGLSGIASANASNENLQSRPHLTRSVVELDCKESDHPHKSNPDSIFVPAEKDFFGTAQAIKTDHRAKVSSKTKAPHQLDSPKEPELRVKDALESDLSPVNKKMDFKSIESDAAPTQSTMKMLLLEKENLQLKNQILSKSNLELSTTRKSQEQISSRADYSDENEELCRLRGIETKHHSLLRSASGPQSHIDHLATENAALKHKVSGQTMEIKSLVEQVEILRIENKKLIESDIQAKSPQKRSSVHRSMDLAAQQALLTAIEETSKTMDVKGNSGARSLLERCCKSLKSAVELTYEETSLAAFRQCLYTTKEIIAQWTMDSLGLDERLARVSAEANTIRQEAQDLVVRMDKKVTELKAENEELHGTIDGLKKDLKLAQSEKQTFQITSQAVTPAPVVPIHDTFSDKTGLESLRFENTQLKLHIDHLEGTIKDWKCENESLLRQLKEIDARPSDRLLELESILDKTQSQLDGERLCLKKAQELIKSLQVEITDMIAETAVLRAGMTSAKETPGTTSLDPTLLAKLKSLGTLKGVTPSVNIAKEVEHIFNLVQENQATLDRLTDLKSDLKGLQKTKKKLEKENEDLKTHLDRLKETLQRREFEWQTQFRDIQSTSQSIHEHHKELEMYLSEYDGQHEAIKALIKSSTPDLVHDMDLDDLPHPYPFLEYFSRFQTTYQSLQHSLNSVSHRFTESQKTVEKLERELETQSTLLDATSQDKAVLAKQYEQTLRNRDAALLQLDASQKAANTFKEKAEVLERKMKNIVQVYACQVALEIVPPRRS